jgi:malonyl-CoA O-methyltransferase
MLPIGRRTDPLNPSLDKRRVRAAFERAAATYDRAAVLQRRVADELVERLDIVRLAPTRILDVGCGTGHALAALERRFRGAEVIGLDIALAMLRRVPRRGRWLRRRPLVAADAEALPVASSSVELVFSNMVLQWCDAERAMSEFVRVLRPGGLLIFSSVGPDTLGELRESWAETDGSVHVHPFADMHDVGDALLRVGFEAPVMDVERFTLTYPDVRGLLADLRALGVQNADGQRRAALTGPERFRRFESAYERRRDADGRIPATYEVVYGHAWKPLARESGAVSVQFGE